MSEAAKKILSARKKGEAYLKQAMEMGVLKRLEVANPEDSFKLAKAPKFPASLSALSPDKLTQLLSDFHAQAGWAASRLALLDARIMFARHAAKVRYDQVSRKFGEKTKPAEVKQEIEATDEEWFIWRQIQVDAEAAREEVSGVHEFYESCAKALSRELTRRVASEYGSGKIRPSSGATFDSDL